ncbi:hypothetical protein F5B22DRAFT_93659 [Xylaria bambusicola]|uniref:uncharacterized protein n=1 Tax=Xylaria bambusicola TaxID=326684 RepID=UPI002008E74F|nr:uncharacterized protein F5B22DRAFT_93659 [Xylaria bambusicola]KAI0517679.1 hypothetical protein F5B22DRAFT_93659 [Xylaria bambusicola]
MVKKKNKPRAKTHPKAKGPPPQHIRQRFGPASNSSDSPFARSHGYTLAEEARNTASNRRGFRGRDAKLRYQPVLFISSGVMDPLKDFEIPKHSSLPVQEKAVSSIYDQSNSLASNAVEPEVSPIQSPVIDRVAEPKSSQLQYEHPAAQSDVDSDSSEEVILFKGRDAARQQQKTFPSRPTSSMVEKARAASPQEVSLDFRVVREIVDVTISSSPGSHEPDFISLKPDRSRSISSHRHRLNRNSDEDDEEAAIIADYIANMQDDFDDDEDDHLEDVTHPGLGSYSFNILRDLGGTDSHAFSSQPSSEGDSEDEMDDDGEEEDRNPQLKSEDERLAHMPAKQEELGLGGSDVMLLDGADADDGWMAATGMPRRKSKRGSKKSRMFQGGSQFPNATKMAEAFDELDLMDMQSSRLQKSKKGPISFGLSDSELEDALNAAIKKDRLKKADKKKAREELRSQGLLGKNVNPHDLRVKYQGGMSLDDLADEIEVFMLSTREQLILPPFDKGARKIVHTIANTFNIKSKSAGAGSGRYPVLYRSKATLPYDQDLFEQAFSRVRRTWFPRVDVDEKVVHAARVLKRAEPRAGKSKAGRSSLILREGDIVGQHASEIGIENKGRAMLEKMGWSKGMSLGTVETQGITVPLTHVIKKTKAGLGDI